MSGLTAALSVTMLAGAARADATPEQLDHLRALLENCGDEIRGSWEGMATFVLNVQTIMGPDWQPSGEWATWIDGLLGDARG